MRLLKYLQFKKLEFISKILCANKVSSIYEFNTVKARHLRQICWVPIPDIKPFATNL